MRFTKLIIYNLTVFLVLLIALEVGFRIAVPDYSYYQRTCAADFNEEARQKMDTNWVHPDSQLGWVCQTKKKLKFYRSDFFDVEYRINEQGFRTPDFTENSDSTLQKKKVLLLGDSFLFGIFLEENQIVANRLQTLLGQEYLVYNMAIPGWGIDQMFQAYQEYVQLIEPDIVLVFFIDDDVSRVVEAFYWGASTKRAYKLADDQLVFRTSTDGQLSKTEGYFCFNSQLINRLYRIGVMKKAQPLTEAVFDRWEAMEKQEERSLKVVRFPRREQIGHSGLKNYDLEPFFASRNIQYKDLEPELRSKTSTQWNSLFIPGDDHPSSKGAEYIAGKLKELLSDPR